MRDPASAVRAALDDVGVALLPDALPHLRPGVADLPVSHGISGNPSRFRLGPVELRPDEAWRTGLSRGQQRAVLTLAAPQLLRLRRSRRSPSPRPAAPTTISAKGPR